MLDLVVLGQVHWSTRVPSDGRHSCRGERVHEHNVVEVRPAVRTERLDVWTYPMGSLVGFHDWVSGGFL